VLQKRQEEVQKNLLGDTILKYAGCPSFDNERSRKPKTSMMVAIGCDVLHRWLGARDIEDFFSGSH
jgi:hypothetical protein